MTREEFISKIWKPYPDGSALLGEFECSRFASFKANDVDNGEAVEDSILGPSCPKEFLVPHDWVAWCKKRRVYFLLSPQLGEAPDKTTRDPIAWVQFLDVVKSFFTTQGLQEIITPYLVQSPGVDHHIDYFEVVATKTGRQWALPTSPEIHLKKHLCQGYERIFEIKHCFRDDLPGENHTAEFAMLEWYRAFAPLEHIAGDLEGLIQKLKPGAPNIQHIKMSELFEKVLSKPLKPGTTLLELKSWADSYGIECVDDDDWNDVFFRIFMEKLEPNLGVDGPVLLWDFPKQQASLAKISNEGWAQRFELYWHGVELANAYLEVNDPVENRQRFEEEALMRKSAGLKASPVDKNFYDWMNFGMPPASGIALGLDRLFRVLRDS